jgi:uncharacterized protein (TIGR01619 family)
LLLNKAELSLAMNENWIFYPCQIEGKAASILVDLDYVDSAPMPGFSTCIQLRIKMKIARADGLSSEEENERLIEIDAAVEAGIDDRDDVKYVGRVTTDGIRDFFFYAKGDSSAENYVGPSLTEFNDYEFESSKHHDHDWNSYLNFLNPSPRDLQVVANNELIAELASNGDIHDAKRPIRHWLNFTSVATRSSAVTHAQAEKFKVINIHDGDGQFSMVIERLDQANFHAINAVTLGLFDLASSLDGKYDGWESPIAKMQ